MTFLDEIIPQSTINNMKHLSDNFDMFGVGIRQLLNFQFMLYESLNELATKFTSLKSEVSYLSNQVLNVDDAVNTYLSHHPVEVLTRDGMPVNDALTTLQERINATSERLKSIDEKNHRYEALFEDAVTKEDIGYLNLELEKTTEVNNETSNAIKKLQKEINKQKDSEDNMWNEVKDIVRQQMEQYESMMNQKIESSDLLDYVKHAELAEVCTLLRSVPNDSKTRIPEILPQVFRLTGISMDEKLQRAYDLLHIERKRINAEKQQLKDAFSELKEKAALSAYQESEEEMIEFEVRDVGTDSGFVEFEDARTQKIKKFSKRMAVATNFDGPDKIFSEHDLTIQELIDSCDMEDDGSFQIKNNNINDIVKAVVNQSQAIIERQLGLLLKSLGVQIDKNDIKTLVNQLSIIEELQQEMEAIHFKLDLKVDRSLFLEALKKYMLKDEFYENSNSKTNYSLTPLPKVTNKSAQVQKRSKTAQHNRPVPLVPARNPYMLGVNDKFTKGKDNKLYLRDTGPATDKSYKEPPITGSPNRSYFERSKMSMEYDGIESILDFQPFVPPEKSQLIQVEPCKSDLVT